MRQNYRPSSIQEDWGSLVLRHRVCSSVEFCELVLSWSACWGSDVSWNALSYNILTSFLGRLERRRSLCCLPSNEIFRAHIDAWDCLKRKFPVYWCNVEVTTDSRMFWHYILSSGTKLIIPDLYTVPVQIFVQSLNRVIRVSFLHLLNFLTNTEDVTLNTAFLSLFKYFPVDHPQIFFQNYFSL